MYLMPSNSVSEPRTLHPCTFFDRDALPATDKDFRAKAVNPTTFQKPGGATTFSGSQEDGFPPPHSDEPTEFDMTPDEAVAALTAEAEDLGLYEDPPLPEPELVGPDASGEIKRTRASKKSTGPAPD